MAAYRLRATYEITLCMYKIFILAFLIVGFAVPAYAEESASTTPPKPRPGFYQHAIERAEKAKDGLEERDGIFRENFLENHEGIRDRIRDHASTTKGNILERREEWKLRWEARHEKFGSTTGEWKARFSDEMKGRIANRADHAANVLARVLERLAGLADRIQSRIDELSAGGGDVSEAEAALVEADAVIAEAEEAVQALTDAMATALASENPQESIVGITTLREAAKQALRAAHEALKAAAQALPQSVGNTLEEDAVTE